MKRLLLLAMAVAMLSGCSELHAIGNATIRELRAEAINVEMNAYVQPVLMQEPVSKERIVVAKVEKAEVAKVSKTRRKGLWEKI